MLELMEGCCNVTWLWDVNGVSIVIPIQGWATVELAFPVCCCLIVFFEAHWRDDWHVVCQHTSLQSCWQLGKTWLGISWPVWQFRHCCWHQRNLLNLWFVSRRFQLVTSLQPSSSSSMMKWTKCKDKCSSKAWLSDEVLWLSCSLLVANCGVECHWFLVTDDRRTSLRVAWGWLGGLTTNQTIKYALINNCTHPSCGKLQTTCFLLYHYSRIST